MPELIYKDFVFKIGGLLYEMYNELGFGFQEKYYQRAFEQLLIENKIAYQKELHFPIIFKEKIIGRYFIDFVLDKKVALEFKVCEDFKIDHVQQLLGYLRTNKLRLGLIVLITRKGIKFKRIIN